jgi:hypothetical protein
VNVPPPLRPGYEAPPTPRKACSGCMYWRPSGITSGANMYGDCCRYPKREVTESRHWCGEFFKKANPLPETRAHE